MSAPVIWIVFPLLVSVVLFPFRNQKTVNISAILLTFFLAISAWILPIETAISVGKISMKLSSTLVILGRQLILTSADKSVLVLIYGSAFIWFIPVLVQKQVPRFIPLCLAITSLLVASLAVEPFLYAAMIIEIAVLLSIPILSTPNQKPGKGLSRYLIFQTLAVPFILFAGWIMGGIEANPGDIGLVRTAGILLGMGFAFLLALFPFYTWIPLLSEETDPFPLGFVLWIIPTATLLFAVSFLDRYTWLRDASFIGPILTITGILMITTGGIFSAFERNLGRMMGYAVIMESGYSILALGIGGKTGIDVFLFLFIPRLFSLVLWAYSLSLVSRDNKSLRLHDIRGMGRIQPHVTAGLILSSMSIAGTPLLVGFVAHLYAWEVMAEKSLAMAFWILVGNVGLFMGILKMLRALIEKPPIQPLTPIVTRAQKSLIILGGVALIIFGIFPQWIQLIWLKLPTIFLHLTQ